MKILNFNQGEGLWLTVKEQNKQILSVLPRYIVAKNAGMLVVIMVQKIIAPSKLF